MASINQQPQLATNGRAKMSRRSVAALPSLFRPAPGAKSPRKSELGAKQGHGRLPRRGAVADETDTETAGQTLVKKQRSAATPKLKVAGSTKLAAASKSMIYVTILMNFLIHELNKFTSIESPSQYFFIL